MVRPGDLRINDLLAQALEQALQDPAFAAFAETVRGSAFVQRDETKMLWPYTPVVKDAHWPPYSPIISLIPPIHRCCRPRSTPRHPRRLLPHVNKAIV